MKKRKNRDGKDTLKKIGKVIKKGSEAEKRKSELKKLEKKNKPKGYQARKLGMITFWALFMFMFLVVFVNLFGTSNAEGEVRQETRNKVMDSEGQAFAENFLYEYFTWRTDDYAKERRIMKLQPYLVNGLDDMAGVIYNNKWSSSIDKRNIVVKDIEDLGDNKARYVFKVIFTLKGQTDETDTVPSEGRLSFEDTLKEERKAKVKDGVKTKITEKYISVPIVYDEIQNTFGVYELPSFTYVDDEKSQANSEHYLADLRPNIDGYTENNILAFLDVFFESYTKDEKDKITYILEDEKHQSGLKGTMLFSRVKNANVYEVSNRFIVDAEIMLVDPTTHIEFTSNYVLVIEQKEQRYVVKSLNDENYVIDLIESASFEGQNDLDETAEETHEYERDRTIFDDVDMDEGEEVGRSDNEVDLNEEINDPEKESQEEDQEKVDEETES